MDREYINRHERDIEKLESNNKLLMKQITENKKQIAIIRMQNRQIKGREGNE